MYAAKLLNEREGNPRNVIFGCATNALSWCFLKLEDKNLYIDPNYVPLTFTKPHEVVSTLQWILDECLKYKISNSIFSFLSLALFYHSDYLPNTHKSLSEAKKKQ